MKQIFIKAPYARVQKIRDDAASRMNTVRLYEHSPGRCMLQIRAAGPINENGNGKPFNMIAGSTLGVDEADELAYALQLWVCEQRQRG